MTTRWWVSQYGLRITGERDAWRDPGYRLCAGSRWQSNFAIGNFRRDDRAGTAACSCSHRRRGNRQRPPGATPESGAAGVGLRGRSSDRTKKVNLGCLGPCARRTPRAVPVRGCAGDKLTLRRLPSPTHRLAYSVSSRDLSVLLRSRLVLPSRAVRNSPWYGG